MDAEIKPWANHSLDVDDGAVFASFERAAPVSLIATFGSNLICCETTDIIADVLRDPALAQFDFVPARRDGQIVGLLIRGTVASAVEVGKFGPDASVSAAMAPLSESILISADTGLLTFVASSDMHPCRLVIRGTRIDGIVTIADIQKLPVRPILFLLVTHLEMLMAEAIRVVYRSGDVWLSGLGRERREGLEKRWAERRDRGIEIDKLLMSQFADKKEALIASAISLPYGRTKSERQLDRIRQLRDDLAHANEYAPTAAAAGRCAETVRIARKWIDHLNGWLSEERTAAASGTGRIEAEC